MDGRERSSVVHAHVRVMKVEAATSKRVNVNARMNASSLINYLLKFLSDWDLGQRTIVAFLPFHSFPFAFLFRLPTKWNAVVSVAFRLFSFFFAVFD